MSFYQFPTESYAVKPAKKTPRKVNRTSKRKPAERKPAVKKEIIKERVDPKTQGRELTYQRPTRRVKYNV